MIERARAILDRLVQTHPDEPKYLRHLAWFSYAEGNLLSDKRRRRRRPRRREGPLRSGPGPAAEAHRGPPERARLPERHGAVLRQPRRSLHAEGRPRGRDPLPQRALGLQKKIATAHPSVTLYLLDVAATLYNLGWQYHQVKELDDSFRAYQEATEINERLVALDPDNLEFQSHLAEAVNNLGIVLLDRGKNELALEAFRKAIAHERPVFEKAPQVPKYRMFLFNPTLNVSQAMRALGRPDDAVAAALEARALAAGQPEDLVNVARELSQSAALAEGRTDRVHFANLAVETFVRPWRPGS